MLRAKARAAHSAGGRRTIGSILLAGAEIKLKLLPVEAQAYADNHRPAT